MNIDTAIQDASSKDDLADLDTLMDQGDVNETPFNVFIGHNLGHRVFTIAVPFRQFYEISDVANDRDAGPVAQRPLDANHAKSLAKYMLRGLVSAAKLRCETQGNTPSPAFEALLKQMGTQPYFSLQPVVCNIRNIPQGGSGAGGIRGMALKTEKGDIAAFKVFLAERHILWVIDGQHRRAGAEMVMQFLTTVRQTGRYPAKSAALFDAKGTEVTSADMDVWNQAYDAARAYATLTVEVHLGLDIDQERQLFHDLNKLGKKVSSSLAHQFDSSNPLTRFIKSNLVESGLIEIVDRDVKDWSDDTGALALKDVVAVNAIGFMNKTNATGATPALIEARQEVVHRLWQQISDIPGFGEAKAKTLTVAAQPVMLKALAKIAFDMNFSNRRPDDGAAMFDRFLDQITDVDFSHGNPMWRFYDLSEDERRDNSLQGLGDHLPSDEDGANRDVGAFQGGFMRFGAKHNDIFPILADMLRWKTGLPSRH